MCAQRGSHLSPHGRADAGEAPGADLAALLDAVARGDRDAFEAVCHDIAGPVFGMVRSVVRDRCQSEEVAQEVLLEVWRAAPRYDAGRAARWRG